MLAIGESRFFNAKMNRTQGGADMIVCGLLKLAERGHQWSFDPARHGKNYNLLLCDGHVEAIDPWVLFDPTKTASRWHYDNRLHPEFWMPQIWVVN